MVKIVLLRVHNKINNVVCVAGSHGPLLGAA